MGSLPLNTWIGAGLVFVAVALGAVSLSLVIEWVQARLRKRGVQKQIEQLAANGVMGKEEGLSLLRPDKVEHDPSLAGRLWEKLPNRVDLEILLEQAALKWSAQTFLVLSVGHSLALGVGILIATRNLFFAAIAAGIGATLPYHRAKRKRQQRMDKFEEGLPEAIDLLGRALRAGYPITAGFKMVGEEAEEPIAGEFRHMFEQQRFGLAFEDSMLGMADRVPLTDVRIFVTAVLIQREVGGNLTEILDKLSSVIRERFSIYRDLRSKTAQGRLSGLVLAGMPPVLAGVMTLIDPDRMGLFFESFLGQIMVAVAVFLQLVGFLWIRRVIRIEV